MRWLVLLGRLVALGAFVGGCASTAPSPRLTLAAQVEDDDPDTHLTDLPHGQAAPGTTDAVVRVIAHGAVCSGALVGPNLVLTAQHCVAGRDGNDADVLLPPGFVWVELGGDPLPWGRVRARRLVPCAGWDGSAAYDVAALVLDAPVPDVTPLPIGVAADGEAMRRLGFGTGMVTRVIPQTPWRTFEAHRNAIAGSLTAQDDAVVVLDVGAHGGDSGGPIVNARGELVALTAVGREGATDGTGGGPLTVGARVDACPSMFRDAMR
jgi:hypothetical protein